MASSAIHDRGLCPSITTVCRQFDGSGRVSYTNERNDPRDLGYVFCSENYRSPSIYTSADESGWRKPSALDGYVVRLGVYRCSAIGRGDSGYRMDVTNHTTTYHLPRRSSSAELLAKLDNKLLSKLKDQTVNLSIAFAQRAKTAALITDSVRKVTGYINDISRVVRSYKKSLRSKKAKGRLMSTWKEIPQAWLIWNYGIIPTMLDVEGAITALEKADNGSFDRYLLTVKSGFKVKTSRSFQTTNRCSFGIDDFTWSFKEEETLSMLGRIDCRLRSPEYLKASELGVVNLGQTVWDVIPYSFVVDWFVNVGEYISLLDANVPWEFRGGSRTFFQEGTVKLKDVSLLRGTVSSTSSSNAYVRSFERTVMNGFPLPTLRLKEDPFSLRHISLALSLLATAAQRAESPRFRR